MLHRQSPIILIALLAGLLLLPTGSCSKIELPEETKEETGGNAGDNSGEEEDGDDDDGKPEDGNMLSIVAALKATPEQDVMLQGYIVGYVAGTGLSKAVFGLPATAANTNMLLADSPDETDVTRCLPVRLPKDGALALREVFNLYDNPENYRRPVALYGWLTTYFGTNGFRDVYDYQWLGESGDTPIEPTPTPGNEPETPGLDDTPSVQPDGR